MKGRSVLGIVALETGTLPKEKEKIDEPEINFDTDPRWKASGG